MYVCMYVCVFVCVCQSEGFPRTGYLFPARDGLWPGLKKEVLLARRRRRRRRHLGIGPFQENKKCCILRK